MLELLGYIEKYDNFIRYERQELKTCLLTSEYFLLDTVNEILYYYTYKDIQKQFFIKHIPIKGFIDEYKIEDLSKNTNFQNQVNSNSVNIMIQKPLKVVRSDSVSRTLNVFYKEIIFVLENSLKSIRRELFENLYIDYYDFTEIILQNTGKIPSIYLKDFRRKLLLSQLSKPNMKEFISSYTELYKKDNKLNTFNKLFALREQELVFDLRRLPCENIIDCSEMFRGCICLKTVRFCKLDISNPVKFTNMFHSCISLETVDFSMLKGDYFNCDNDLDYTELGMLLYLGIDRINTYCIIVLSNKTINFNKCLIERNKLQRLGTIRDYSDLDKLRGKLILKGINPNENIYYVIKNN